MSSVFKVVKEVAQRCESQAMITKIEEFVAKQLKREKLAEAELETMDIIEVYSGVFRG
jgi:hypothetical protein